MKHKVENPRLPRTRAMLLANHRNWIVQARESRLLGWKREAAYALRSASIERTCIQYQERAA